MSRKRQEQLEVEKEVTERWPTKEAIFLNKKLQHDKENDAVIKIIDNVKYLRVKSLRLFNPFLDANFGPDYNPSQFAWKAVEERAYRYYTEFLTTKDIPKFYNAERIING